MTVKSSLITKVFDCLEIITMISPNDLCGDLGGEHW